jgi:hypothetical protein
MLPENIAMIAGVLTAWAGSHFFGVGEIVDVVLLAVGVVVLGFAMFEGAGALHDFTTVAISARSDSQLDAAGQHLARAVTLLGVSTLQALLLRGQGRSIIARGRPRVCPRPNVGVPPTWGSPLRLSRPAQISSGSLGETRPSLPRVALHCGLRSRITISSSVEYSLGAHKRKHAEGRR